LLDNSANFASSRIKDLSQKWKVNLLIFRGAWSSLTASPDWSYVTPYFSTNPRHSLRLYAGSSPIGVGIGPSLWGWGGDGDRNHGDGWGNGRALVPVQLSSQGQLSDQAIKPFQITLYVRFPKCPNIQQSRFLTVTACRRHEKLVFTFHSLAHIVFHPGWCETCRAI